MGLQTMNAPIGAITIWSGAYNSSFLVNFLQANNMPKPNLQDGHKTNHNNSLQIPPSENFGHFQGGDLHRIQIRAASAAGFLRKLILLSILPRSV